MTRALIARGGLVAVQVRRAQRLPADLRGKVELHEADLARAGTARALVERSRPDVVFNLVGYGVAKDEREPRTAERLNTELPRELTSTLLARSGPDAVRLVHVGSALEAGPGPKSLDEAAPCAPDSDYGRSKLVATQALATARSQGLACLTARAFTVYGLGERPGRLLPMLLAAREQAERIPLSDGVQERDWIYVEDAARALVDLAQADPTPVRAGEAPFDAPTINLATGSLRSVRGFVEAFAAFFGVARDRLGFGDLPGLAEEMFHPPVPVARLQQALGWLPSGDVSLAFERIRQHLRAGVLA